MVSDAYAADERNASRFGRRGLIAFCVGVSMIVLTATLGVTGLGPLDDHHMMRTVFQNKPFGWYIIPELGRFFPATAQEYILAATLFHPSPTLFYAINAFKIPLCGFLLLACLMRVRLSGVAAAILWCVTMLSSGVANTLFRLSAGELNTLVLVLCLAWTCLLVLDDSDASDRARVLATVAGIAAFSLSLFYKELAFALGLIFGVVEYWRAYRQHRRVHVLVLSMIGIGLLYIAGYAAWRFLAATGSYAAFYDIPFVDILASFVDSDPFMVFVVLPVTAVRVVVVMTRPERQGIHDAFLVAASAYVCAFLVLRLYSPYYLLPAYGFAAVGLARLMAVTPNVLLRRCVIAVVGLCTIDVLPVFASDIQTQKATVNNHFEFVKGLSRWLVGPGENGGQPRNLVLAGVNPGNYAEIVKSLEIYLTSLGVPEKSIAIKGTEATNNARVSDFYKSGAGGYAPVANDVLVFNPYREPQTPPPLVVPSYRQLLRSSTEWTLPRWRARDWWQLCVVQRSRCEQAIVAARRYAGYAAFLVLRDPIAPAPPQPLVDPSYRVGLLDVPERMRTAETYRVWAMLRNTGAESWPATGKLEGGRYVNLSYRWYDAKGVPVVEGNRTALPEPMRTDDLAQIAMEIVAPRAAGRYRLSIIPVQEAVLWFKVTDERWIDVID